MKKIEPSYFHFIFSFAAILGICVFLVIPHASLAQTGTTSSQMIPESAQMTLIAKIKSIDPVTRQVTLIGKDGNQVVVDVGPAVRLNMLHKDDEVTVRYYRSVAFALSQPGTTPPQNGTALLVTRPASAPGGVAIRLIKVSGVVYGVDLASHTVQIVDPRGGIVHTVVVTDPARIALLSQLKVGSTVTAVISETLAVSIRPSTKAL